MSKIKIKATLKNKEKTYTWKVLADNNKSKISYKEDNNLITFDYKQLHLIRKTPSGTMLFKFKEHEPLLILQVANMPDMSIPINVETIIQQDFNVTIKYFLGPEEFTYKIEV